ncbi:MAG: RtcB family protein [Deltaproteobacteria bacterium]|nr:RtcB family protein [Deltaproteobacteria bacterium]
MKARELAELGVPRAERCMRAALEAVGEALGGGMALAQVRESIAALAREPEAFLEQPVFGALAAAIVELRSARARYEGRRKPAPFRCWGEDLDAGSIQQMQNAVRLPIAVRGALMPDAHKGYGLPIGGVLAADGAVIPYAVGVDIACRMKLSVLDMPAALLDSQQDRLARAIEAECRFGVGATFEPRRQHAVMDEDWDAGPVTAQVKDRAHGQLGTSGSGNHFVEFGILRFERDDLGMQAGAYLALLSHSGSRGAGNLVATHYSKLARELHDELPDELAHLAWLDLDTDAGREYWQAMELMGRYAAANHELIHRCVVAHLGAEVLLDIENHHNFAWREVHDGREVIVHRKGSTPAGPGVLGVIPGSMGTPGYLVRGKGQPESLHSASHGAGRRMSRTQAKKELDWAEAERFLAQRGVVLLSAGLDEVPMAYKDIEQVMQAQADLVEPVARFEPRLVKMAPAGERPED